MPGGIYVALSGLRHQSERLDRIASDIANASTAGYKSQRSTSVAVARPSFSRAIQAAIDVTPGETKIYFRPGGVVRTGRDLDFALHGPGFFVIETPDGPQYTRNGHFEVLTDGTLATPDGLPVQGVEGPLVLPSGAVDVQADGTVLVNGVPSGRLLVEDFEDYSVLNRKELGRFAAPRGVTPTEVTDTTLRGQVLEGSNVSIAERMVEVTDVSRTFEGLQRGISVLMNDIDGRAITELGRR